MAYADRPKDEEEATNDYSSYWQSIPDPPPTPKVSTDNSNGDDNDVKVSEVEPRRHHNRKKKNAFRDVTNSAATSTAVDNNNNNNPADDDDDDGGIDKCVATLRSIGDGGINEKKSSKKSKRRKKRKSLLLPSDEGQLIPPLATSCLHNNHKSTELSSINNNNSSSYNKQVLTQLVRDYCQLPNEQRIKSTQSKQIEALSSYPMPGKVIQLMNNTSTNNKHEFLLRVQPIVQEMEIKKKRDILETKLATQCEVRKERGGFCYYDINSGEQVMPDEYKIRYGRMVDEQLKKRRVVVNEEEGNDVGGIGEEKKEKDLNQTEANHNHSKQEETHGDDCKDNEHEPTNVDDSNMEIDESMEDSMNMSHDDSTMSRGKEDDDKQCRKKAAKSSPLDNVSSSTKEEVQGTTDESQSQPASNDTSNPLSRMPPSDDPRVIAARKTLFTAIDTALANYSEEILAIEAAGNKGR